MFVKFARRKPTMTSKRRDSKALRPFLIAIIFVFCVFIIGGGRSLIQVRQRMSVYTTSLVVGFILVASVSQSGILDCISLKTGPSCYCARYIG